MKLVSCEMNTCFLSPQDIFDYEVDSDEEWEEDEPGESLSHSEGVSIVLLGGGGVALCLNFKKDSCLL